MARQGMPSVKQISDFWGQTLADMGKADSAEEVDGTWCFACGFDWGSTMERAHILAVCEGGSNNVDNIHILCSACHRASEVISGEKYWDWFESSGFLSGGFNNLAKFGPSAFTTIVRELELKK